MFNCYTNMTNFKINYSRTYLPLGKINGTTEQRLSKAIDANVKFLKNLKYDFVDREVSMPTFKRTLKDSSDKKISLNIFGSNEHTQNESMTHSVGKTKISSGYTLYVPQTFDEKHIPQGKAQEFMQTTQKFFNELYNPKFYKRKINMLNRNQGIKEVSEFYETNIKGTNKLNTKDLDEFLNDKSADEKINSLQMMRYDVMAERNNENAKFPIDKQIEKIENLKIQNKSYDLTKFQYNEKLDILNEKLKNILKTERENIKIENIQKAEKEKISNKSNS